MFSPTEIHHLVFIKWLAKIKAWKCAPFVNLMIQKLQFQELLIPLISRIFLSAYWKLKISQPWTTLLSLPHLWCLKEGLCMRSAHSLFILGSMEANLMWGREPIIRSKIFGGSLAHNYNIIQYHGPCFRNILVGCWSSIWIWVSMCSFSKYTTFRF